MSLTAFCLANVYQFFLKIQLQFVKYKFLNHVLSMQDIKKVVSLAVKGLKLQTWDLDLVNRYPRIPLYPN